MIKTIAIYAVSEVYGGVEVLTSRFCDYLQEKQIKFVLITRKKTRISEKLKWAPQVTPEKIDEINGEISHLLLPSITFILNDIPWNQLHNVKILSWIVHPTSIYTAFFPGSYESLGKVGFFPSRLLSLLFFRHHVRVSNLFCQALEKNALIAMDGATKRCLNFFYPKTKNSKCPIVPIPTTQPSRAMKKRHFLDKNSISIGYLGRLNEFKLSAINSFIEENILFLENKYKHIHLHIVAEGESIDKLSKLCNEKNIIIHKHGFQSNDKAKETISKQTDLAICMGTAALDIASSGHPCIIIDPIHKKTFKNQEKYRFVHEIDEFTLGEYQDFPHYKRGLHSLEEVIEAMKVNPSMGEAGREYVENNHNPNKSFQLLVDHITASTMRIKDIKNEIQLLKKSKDNCEMTLDKIRNVFFLKSFWHRI